ncbi:hypothetical protein OIDMADRAFT_102684 [Oidiodendron maius Zn]|uniref:DUF726-domain-containing protein n=1 Tax=Oidiodendron maius (strain Zn) TaxID=913774 RepID=A0A0C3H306_OIDMZ|nr:hypothetical protein OIDMADRAFT_102684 [Oidiodendron maius Zn]
MALQSSVDTQPAKGDGKDIQQLLSAEERGQLTLLVADITKLMAKQICDIFDSSIASLTKPRHILQTGDINPNVIGSRPHKETEEEERTRHLLERREKELSEPKMLELKIEAIKFFEEWRVSLTSRVGDAVNNLKEVVVEQNPDESAGKSLQTRAPSEAQVTTPSTNTEEADATLIQLYPPTSTPLCSLQREKRILLLHAILLLVLSLEHYVAYSRILLLHISSSLHLPLHLLAEQEVKLAQGLLEAAEQMSGDEEAEKRSDENKVSRRWKVGLAGVAGAAVIGITGGLAAPLVAAAIGTVMAGLGLEATAAAALLGTLAESGVIIGSLFGAYGGRMTGKMMDAYAKEVDDFAFLPLKGSRHHEPQPADRRLRVTIGVSGWLTQKEDVITPWRAFGHQSEVFALRWELKELSKLGHSMESVVKSAAWSVAKKEIIARTIFASLLEAFWPISLLKVAKVIDNPFSVHTGERPVTLIGYSLGARLIYSCLMSLAERRAFGLIESVVLIGTPAPSVSADWRAIRSVVAGRLVNVYSEHDYILGFLYRTSTIQLGVAGLQEVEDVRGVENVNVTDIVSGHLRYQYLCGTILERIGFEDIDIEEVAKEQETIALLDEEEMKERKKKEGKEIDPAKEAEEMEKEVKHKTEMGLMHKAAEKLHLGS